MSRPHRRHCECPSCRDMRELRRLHPELRRTSWEDWHDLGRALVDLREAVLRTLRVERAAVALSNLIVRVRRGKGTHR